mgnify:CR=1 FL=1
MNELGKGFDGTVEKAISSTEKLKNLPKILQKYMMWGDYKSGLITKIDGSKFGDSIDGENIQNYVAQISNLDKAQRNAIISVTKLDKESKAAIQDLIDLIQTGSRINGKVFESSLKSAGNSEINQGDINSLMNALGMKNGDNYALPDTNEVKKNLNMWAKAAENADAKTRLMNAGIIESTKNGYAMTDSFKKMIGIEEVDGVVKTGLTAKQLALNTAMQIGKQLALSFGVAIATWAISKAVDYIMNLKTHSEELVETMNDSHDAAEQATKDVEEIQSKIDELNNSLEAAGVKKIEDIIDPAERERLQAINDMLQAQLELKKQLEKDAADKANADTSAVVNDKTEDSIVKYHTVNVSYAEGGANAGTHQVAEKVSKTESLNEHSDYLDQLVQKRREMAAAGEEETQVYKDNEVEIEKEKTKIEELSSAVSEQMSNYSTDADNFDQYKDEYVTGTNAMTAATKALANANDDVGISTTAYDILLQKMQATKNLMDRRNKDTSNSNPYTGAVKTLKASGLETGDDIRELSAVPANQTKAQAEAIKVLENAAKDAGVTLDQFVSALESVGLIAVRNVNNIKSLSDAMSTLDNMQSAYQSCAQAVKEYNNTGYVTMDTLQSLCQLEPQYLKMLELKNGKLKINTKTAQALTQANIQLAKASLLADTLNNIKENNNLVKAKSILGDVTAVISDADTALTAAAQKSQNEAKDSGGWEAYDYTSRANSVLIDNYHTLSDLFDTLGRQNPSKIWGKDDTSKSTKQATSAVDAWSTLTSAMKEYNEQGYITFQTLKSLTSLEDKYSSMLKKNDVTGQLEMRTDDFYKLMKAELKEAQIKGDGASEAQYNKILEWTNRNIKNQTMSYWDLVAAIEGYSATLSGAKEITDTFKDAWGNGKTVKEKQEKSHAGALDYEGTEAQSSALQDLMKYSEYDPELIGKAFNKETGKIDLSGDMLKTAVTESLKQQAAAARTEGGAAAEAIAASYEKSAENIENDVISVQDYFDGLGSTIEEVNTKIDDLQSAWSALSDVTNEYNTYGGLSVDSIQKLLTMSPEYLQFLKMDGDQLVFNRDAMLAYAKANLLTKAAELELKDETKAQAEILRALANSLDKGADSMDGMGSSAEKLKSGLSDLKDVFSSLLSLFEKFNTDKDNDLKLWGEAMTEDIDKRIEALNKQKEALEKANDEEERAITLAKLKAELEKARTQRTVRKLTSNGYEWVADESAVKEAKDNLSDQQREWRKEDAEKAIDDQIGKLNELKDKYSEAMNLIGTSLDDYNKKLRYAAQIQDMTFSEMEGLVDEYKNKIIASFTSAAPISGIQNLISNIESLIDTLTKLNNVYSWIQTGEYKDKGTKGLWNTIKGFFNNGKSENVNKSFKDTFNAAKKAFNAGKKQLTDTATTGVTDVINATINQIKTSGNGLVEAFSGIWEKIKGGVQNLFGGSGSGGGIISTVVNGFKVIGNAVSKSKIGSAIVSGGGKLLAGAGKLIGTAGSALAAAGPYAIPIAAAAGLGIYSGVKSINHQKEIWSNKEDGFGKKAMKSVATFFWDISPIGGIVNLCKDIFGKNKEIADNTKNNGKDNTSSGTTNSSEGTVIGNIKGKKAGGSRSVKQSGRYNVDERGPELLVRQPTSGRYTYLETGDGVVPADITSRLFDMGGNPDRWFTEQMERNAGISNVQNRTVEGDKITIGDIYIQNPVGGVDDLAREINQRMPVMFKQIQSKR